MSTAVEPYQAGVFDLTHKLTVEKHGHTALITINHPPANTWDRESLIGLKQVIDHLNHDDDIYALVICGQGEKFFSAGADLKLFADGDRNRAREMARRFGEAFEALRDFRGVSIAAINGFALGGGLECALACDLRIAEQQAQMGLPEASVGLLPCAGGTQALAWLVGEGWAKRMILCGERITADTALRIGLVEQVVEPRPIAWSRTDARIPGRTTKPCCGACDQAVDRRSPSACAQYARRRRARGLRRAVRGR